jgi:hypothetical protein
MQAITSSPHSQFFLTLLNPNFDSNFTAEAAKIYSPHGALYEKTLALKPLKLLEELDKTYQPFFSFHLRELYLNFNLLDVVPHKKENQAMFHHLNDPFLHQYFLYLFSASIAPEAILPYI